jgi:alkanesulfonate monooxygenase SsuD/methylene tetrahydromethanopterin reductase-like flavin-dependent oxidoreductase (luciferase family)
VQVEAEHGMAYGRPLTRVRETVEVIRRLLQEGRISYQGETIRIESFDLWFSPRHRTIPIYASAVSQKMTALCGEIADGIILTRSTLATAAVVREQLAEGARRAGRDPGQTMVTTLLPASVGETRREALDALRPGLAFYAGFFPATIVYWQQLRNPAFALFDQNFDRVGSSCRRNPLAQNLARDFMTQRSSGLPAIAPAVLCHPRQSIANVDFQERMLVIGRQGVHHWFAFQTGPREGPRTRPKAATRRAHFVGGFAPNGC